MEDGDAAAARGGRHDLGGGSEAAPTVDALKLAMVDTKDIQLRNGLKSNCFRREIGC